MHHLDPAQFKKEVGVRIRTARTSSGYKTRADLTGHFPDWSEGRLANYESGTSLPGPIDILRIAEQTGTNPCWLLFGRGSMLHHEPDIHQVRHQNLARICSGLSALELSNLRRKIKVKSREFDNILKNPTTRIGKSLCSKIENGLGLEKGVMDRPVLDPDQNQNNMSPMMAELFKIFDGLNADSQQALVNIAREIEGL